MVINQIIDEFIRNIIGLVIAVLSVIIGEYISAKLLKRKKQRKGRLK